MGYYASLIQEELIYEPVNLILQQIRLDPVPNFNGGQGCEYYVLSELHRNAFIYHRNFKCYSSIFNYTLI